MEKLEQQEQEVKVWHKQADGTLVDGLGRPCVKFAESGYWRNGSHVYHIKGGKILHVNLTVINALSTSDLHLTQDERMIPIPKEEFENELHNAIIDLGLGSYFK